VVTAGSVVSGLERMFMVSSCEFCRSCSSFGALRQGRHCEEPLQRPRPPKLV
jgi:hypothetical protein